MSEDHDTILNDKRRIVALYYNNDGGERIVSGDDINIEAYGEPGEYCYKPYFRVKRNGAVTRRIPAGMVEVEYDPDSAQSEDEQP